MQISPTVQKMIDIETQSMKTQQDIATAVAVKQMDVAKMQGQQMVDLVTQAAAPTSPSRGIDVRA